ncbi:MAG: hypothetical protein CVU84_14040 [Firmicutes bacterium HGW-Firmicutes-1]|jgi:hypothetical protein|nr:MAG: hypothetical protein CVU84_14040 [Firmicutes bacterium HGW-Firmicutes-1]
MKNKMILIVILIATAITFSACKDTDVVGKVSITSFEAVLNQNPDNIKSDDTTNSWALTSATGERFIWSKDFSNEGTPDAMLEFDAQPFLDAGLDINKLPAEMVSGNKIIYTSELGGDKFTYKGDATPIETYKQIVKTNRDVIGYHANLDHYGIALGNGNMFEWAKDMSTNDKDIVFVLNPQPFIDAGVAPEKVEGWVFAKVEMMDENGKSMETDKFLKPFDLK